MHLLRRSDAKRGGLTLRGVAVQPGGSLLPTSTAGVESQGKILSIGRSRAAGQGVLCSNWQDATELAYARAAHPHYTWQSVLAYSLGLSFETVAIGGQTSSGFGVNLARLPYVGQKSIDKDACQAAFPDLTTDECEHNWYTRALWNDGVTEQTVNFEAAEAASPTRFIFLDWIGEHGNTISSGRDLELLVSFLTMLLKLHPSAVLLRDWAIEDSNNATALAALAGERRTWSSVLSATCVQLPSECHRIIAPPATLQDALTFSTRRAAPSSRAGRSSA